MLRTQRVHRIRRQGRRGGGGRHFDPVRPEEPEPTRAVALQAETVLVDVRVVPPAERAHVLERRRAARVRRRRSERRSSSSVALVSDSPSPAVSTCNASCTFRSLRTGHGDVHGDVCRRTDVPVELRHESSHLRAGSAHGRAGLSRRPVAAATRANADAAARTRAAPPSRAAAAGSATVSRAVRPCRLTWQPASASAARRSVSVSRRSRRAREAASRIAAAALICRHASALAPTRRKAVVRPASTGSPRVAATAVRHRRARALNPHRRRPSLRRRPARARRRHDDHHGARPDDEHDADRVAERRVRAVAAVTRRGPPRLVTSFDASSPHGAVAYCRPSEDAAAGSRLGSATVWTGARLRRACQRAAVSSAQRDGALTAMWGALPRRDAAHVDVRTTPGPIGAQL